MSFVICGLHRIQASEPCYLLEVELSDPAAFDWESVTQEVSGQEPSTWQVAWDERELDEGRWAFFFHDLDLSKPLLTCRGPIQLPEPTQLPPNLEVLKYEPPC